MRSSALRKGGVAMFVLAAMGLGLTAGPRVSATALTQQDQQDVVKIALRVEGMT